MAAAEPPTPTVGRIVHVVGASGRPLAAIVTAESGLTPTLQVFLPEADEGGRFQAPLAGAVYDDGDAPSPGTWHWPPVPKAPAPPAAAGETAPKAKPK